MNRPPDPRPTGILVCGMHRSGTSAVSRVCNLLGAHLGDDLMSPTADNERGYWEHNGLVHLHEILLRGLGVDWDSSAPMPTDWLETPLAVEIRGRLEEAVTQEFGEHHLWLFKDPRLCLTLPLWRGIQTTNDIRLVVLMTYRHPLEVASSLRKRDGFDEETGLLIWLNYMLSAERASRMLPRTIVGYQSVLTAWRPTMKRCGQALTLAWPDWTTETEQEIDSFLTTGLRHNVAGEIDTSGSEVRRLASEAYSALEDAEAEGDIDIERFDEIHAKWATLRSPLQNDLARTRAKLVSAREMLVERIDDLEGLALRASRAERELEGLLSLRGWRALAKLRRLVLRLRR